MALSNKVRPRAVSPHIRAFADAALDVLLMLAWRADLAPADPSISGLVERGAALTAAGAVDDLLLIADELAAALLGSAALRPLDPVERDVLDTLAFALEAVDTDGYHFARSRSIE